MKVGKLSRHSAFGAVMEFFKFSISSDDGQHDPFPGWQYFFVKTKDRKLIKMKHLYVNIMLDSVLDKV